VHKANGSEDDFFAYHGLMAPGVRLMRRLRFPAKMAIVLAYLALPIVIIAVYHVRVVVAQHITLALQREGPAN
jgi:hypothetical protein